MELEEWELDILIDAIDDWKAVPANRGMIKGLLGVLMADDQETAERRIHSSLDEGSENASEREETATLIKAKLIIMKRSIAKIRLLQEAENN